MSTKSILKTLHNWIGIVIMVPLFLVCLTGTILGVQDILQRADNKNQSYVAMSPSEKSYMYAQLLEKDNAFTRFRTPSEDRPYASAFSRGHTKFYDSELNLIDERVRGDHPIMNGIFFFHRHFLIGQAGFIINGIVSFISVVLIILGCYLWFAHYRKLPFKNAVPKNWKANSLFKSHILIGVIVAIPLAILSYTGFHLAIGADWFERNDNTMMQTFELSANDIEAQLNEAQALWSEKELVSVVRIVERVKNRQDSSNQRRQGESQGNTKRRPKMQMTGMELRFSDSTNLSPQGADSMQINLQSGEVLHVSEFAHLPVSEKLKALVRPLHDGLNLPTLYVYFITLISLITSIILAFSTYTFLKRQWLQVLRRTLNTAVQ